MADYRKDSKNEESPFLKENFENYGVQEVNPYLALIGNWLLSHNWILNTISFIWIN